MSNKVYKKKLIIIYFFFIESPGPIPEGMCHGDSGGPLTIQDPHDPDYKPEQHQVVGVLSGGRDCGRVRPVFIAPRVDTNGLFPSKVIFHLPSKVFFIQRSSAMFNCLSLNV